MIATNFFTMIPLLGLVLMVWLFYRCYDKKEKKFDTQKAIWSSVAVIVLMVLAKGLVYDPTQKNNIVKSQEARDVMREARESQFEYIPPSPVGRPDYEERMKERHEKLKESGKEKMDQIMEEGLEETEN